MRYPYALLTATFSHFQPGVEASALRSPRASPELFDSWNALRTTPTFRAECW